MPPLYITGWGFVLLTDSCLQSDRAHSVKTIFTDLLNLTYRLASRPGRGSGLEARCSVKKKKFGIKPHVVYLTCHVSKANYCTERLIKINVKQQTKERAT